MTSNSQTIKVFVRARPMAAGEDPERNILNIDEQSSLISFSREKKGQAEFQFSKVFGGESSQQNVYNECSSIVIQDVIEGINCCVMAYGQTGSGKTYTMYGKGWEDGIPMTKQPSLNNTAEFRDDVSVDENEIKEPEAALNTDNEGTKPSTADENFRNVIPDDDMLGVIPRSITDLFKVLDEKAASSKNFDYSISCQVMQIYNEKIYDLLQDKRRENPLQLRDTKKGDTATVCVRGMSVFRIYSKEEAFQLLRKGLRNRAIRATDFNSESSRSHTILQLFVTIEEEDSQGLQVLKRSTFSLVDLAGSEKWRSSLATNTSDNVVQQSVDQQVKEMTNINTSLHVLGNCVSALIEVPTRKHIPYRDSMLTRLLQDALGGNGRTILIATIHHDSIYREESYSTLQFASRASCIKVVLNNNISMSSDATLAQAQKQIKMLRAKLQELQNSETGSMGSNRRGAPCSLCDSNTKILNTLRKQLQEATEDKEYLQRTLDEHYIPYDLDIVPHKPMIADSDLRQGSLLEIDTEAIQNSKASVMSKSISSLGTLDSDDDGSVGSLTKTNNGRGVKSSQSKRKKHASGANAGSSNRLQQKLKASTIAGTTSPIVSTSNTTRTTLDASDPSIAALTQAPMKPKRVVNSEGYVVDYVAPPVQEVRQSVPALHHSVSAPNSLIPLQKSTDFVAASPQRAKASNLPAKYESSPYNSTSGVTKPKIVKSLIPGEQRTIEAALEAASTALEMDTYTGIKFKKSNSPEKLSPVQPSNSSLLMNNNPVNLSQESIPMKSSVSNVPIKSPAVVMESSVKKEPLFDPNLLAKYTSPTYKVEPVDPVKTNPEPAAPPSKYSSYVPMSSVPIGAACLKHGLDSCVLCQMFGDNGSGSTSSIAAKPVQPYKPIDKATSNLQPTTTSSSHYDYSSQTVNSSSVVNHNISNGNTAVRVPVVTTTTRAKSPYSASLGLNYDSYPSVAEGSAVCKTHGVSDCLLCVLKAKRENSNAAVDTNNAVATQYTPSSYSNRINSMNNSTPPLVPVTSNCGPSSLDSADSGIIGYGFSGNSSERKGISYGFDNKERSELSKSHSNKEYLDMEYNSNKNNTNSSSVNVNNRPPYNAMSSGSYQTSSQQASNNEITKISPRINEIRSIPQVGNRYKAADEDDEDDDLEDSGNHHNTQHHHEAHRKPRHIREMEQASSGANYSSNPVKAHQPSPARTFSTENLQPPPLHQASPNRNNYVPQQQQSQQSFQFPSNVGASQQSYTGNNPPPIRVSQMEEHNNTNNIVSNRGSGYLNSSISSSNSRKENHRYDNYDNSAKVLESPQYVSSPAPVATIPVLPVRSPPRAQQHFAHGGGKSNIHYEEEGENEPENDVDMEDDGEDEDIDGGQYGLNRGDALDLMDRQIDQALMKEKPLKKKKKVKKKVAKKHIPPPAGSAAALQLLAAANVKKRLEKGNNLGR